MPHEMENIELLAIEPFMKFVSGNSSLQDLKLDSLTQGVECQTYIVYLIRDVQMRTVWNGDKNPQGIASPIPVWRITLDVPGYAAAQTDFPKRRCMTKALKRFMASVSDCWRWRGSNPVSSRISSGKVGAGAFFSISLARLFAWVIKLMTTQP